MGSFLGRWWTFIRERYEPISHLVMAGGFALGNGAIAVGVTGGELDLASAAITVLLAFVFFLRLRVFDEIKDHDTDASVNPDRPLARGLISPDEARRVALGLAAVEAALVFVLAPAALVVWAIAFGYSLMMFAEFWIGPWLRPRLELYALSHTFVAAIFGLVVAAAVAPIGLVEVAGAVWVLAPANWAVFNVFEFSRKTFAGSEERTGVPTYSNRLGSWGSAALSLVWVGVALVSAWWLLRGPLPTESLIGVLVLGGGATLLGVAYAVAPQVTLAKAFRAGMLVWAEAYYFSLAATRAVWPT